MTLCCQQNNSLIFRSKIMKAKILMVIVVLFAMLMAGCSSINGLCKDIETVSAWGARTSQDAVDKQEQAKVNRAADLVLANRQGK